jgi:hypothetical protein
MMWPAPYRHPGDYGLVEVDGRLYRDARVWPETLLDMKYWALARWRDSGARRCR